MTRLQPIDDRLWLADGPTVSFLGFPYPTRMVVAELPGGLWVWSPIALDEALVAELDALGAVRWLVEPNHLHHLALSEWSERFPGAEIHAPPSLARKRRDIAFAGELGDAPAPAWASTIDQVVVRGSRAMEEVLFFHRASASCLVGDLIQRHDPKKMSRWQRWIMRADGLVGDAGSTPREWRATFIRREPARAALRRARAWNPRRLIIAHGANATSDGAAALERGLAWIERPWPL